MPTHRTVAENSIKEQYGAENSPGGRKGGLEFVQPGPPAYDEGPTPGKSDLSGLMSAKDSPARKE